jgi:ribosomal protein S18 acetylase RimI-like enzyme
MSHDVRSITFRRYGPEDARKMVGLQRRCLELSHDIDLVPEGFYNSPGFAGGANILCAVDRNGAHVGHAMVLPSYIHPQLKVWMMWMDIRVDPDRPDADRLRDALLDRIIERAGEVQAGLDRPGMLYATYFAQGVESIAYLQSRGFSVVERFYQMQRDLDQPLPDAVPPEGMAIRAWRMETEEEQQRYLEAYDAAFENESKPLERLQHFMGWSGWSQGTTFTAFDGDHVVGSVMAYYEPDTEQNTERVGSTEYVFVRPGWRRRGIARYLVTQALGYLKEHGLRSARLEVAGSNEGALSLYESLGFTRLREEITLGVRLNAPGRLRHSEEDQP